MSSTIVVYKQETGKIGVFTPLAEGVPVEKLIKDCFPENTEYKILKSLSIDDDFFDCYLYDSDSDDGCLFDPALAKEVWKNKWRIARKPKLESLDILFMKALERGDQDEMSDIVEQKNLLRDVTEIDIDGNTPEEIKAVWPEILK